MEPNAMGARGYFCIRQGTFALKAEFNEGTDVISRDQRTAVRNLSVGDDVEIDVNAYSVCTRVRVLHSAE